MAWGSTSDIQASWNLQFGTWLRKGGADMGQKRQKGWLKKETRSQGETWVLFFRTTRKCDGKRVENKLSIGLVKDFSEKSQAWAEVERLHLAINQVDSRRGVTFGDLAQHYAEHELVDQTESIHAKAHNGAILRTNPA
jgi:hypothetical protein